MRLPFFFSPQKRPVFCQKFELVNIGTLFFISYFDLRVSLLLNIKVFYVFIDWNNGVGIIFFRYFAESLSRNIFFSLTKSFGCWYPYYSAVHRKSRLLEARIILYGICTSIDLVNLFSGMIYRFIRVVEDLLYLVTPKVSTTAKMVDLRWTQLKAAPTIDLCEEE